MRRGSCKAGLGMQHHEIEVRHAFRVLSHEVIKGHAIARRNRKEEYKGVHIQSAERASSQGKKSQFEEYLNIGTAKYKVLWSTNNQVIRYCTERILQRRIAFGVVEIVRDDGVAGLEGKPGHNENIE